MVKFHYNRPGIKNPNVNQSDIDDANKMYEVAIKNPEVMGKAREELEKLKEELKKLGGSMEQGAMARLEELKKALWDAEEKLYEGIRYQPLPPVKNLNDLAELAERVQAANPETRVCVGSLCGGYFDDEDHFKAEKEYEDVKRMYERERAFQEAPAYSSD
jgi:hypothetical protein